MRVLIALTVILTTGLLRAEVYYVDRTDGADHRTGQSPNEAWRSLARVGAQSLRPGDYVLLKRGDVWPEPLIIRSSGVSGVPITLGAYGAAAAAPAIDGKLLSASAATSLVQIEDQHDVVLAGLAIRNSNRSGVEVLRGTRVTLRDLTVSGNQRFGILVFNSNSITVETSQIFNNALDTSDSYDGIRIDGGTAEMRGFVIRNNSIHHQVGGDGWRSANGIFLGHTTAAFTTLRDVRIIGNDVYANGNPQQNQAGRGISGTTHGDVTVSGNYIHENASAGLYLGDRGMLLDLVLENNTFFNNSLRQFGGFTDLRARAVRNLSVVDDPNLTAMGTEFGGQGQWLLDSNAFFYITTTTDTYRGFIRLNDAGQERMLVSDRNLFYSPTPLPWVLPDGRRVSFTVWQSAGFDLHSSNPR